MYSIELLRQWDVEREALVAENKQLREQLTENMHGAKEFIYALILNQPWRKRMNWIRIEEKKPDIGKVVLFASCYESFADSVDYAIGYLNENGEYEAETEGLYFSGMNYSSDVELGFDPTHWAAIDHP